MAKTENIEEQVQAQPGAGKTKPEATFDKAEIIKSATAFDATPELMAGALTTIDKAQMTKQEAKDALASFRKRPVERSK